MRIEQMLDRALSPVVTKNLASSAGAAFASYFTSISYTRDATQGERLCTTKAGISSRRQWKRERVSSIGQRWLC
jgi:hypothetical protein